MPSPSITWDEHRPRSTQFNDIYFSVDGPKETRRVFIEPADLMNRIQRGNRFSIFELGFGTGLNFLSFATELMASGTSTRVRYISVEKYPFDRASLERVWQPFKDELSLTNQLISQLPPPIAGWHRRYFLDGQLELVLFYGDVAKAMSTFVENDHTGVDAWFLDGFSPDRNTDMWTPQLFQAMHSRTNHDGTVTSFSVAGSVRQNLENCGFEVHRVHREDSSKRHTLLARVKAGTFRPNTRPSMVRVVGGGLAGTCVARTLAQRDVEVQLYDNNANVGMGTSVIPAAIQHPRLSAAATPLASYRIHAYAHAQAALLGYEAVTCTGALHLADDGMPEERLRSIAEILNPDWVQFMDAEQARGFNGSLKEPAAWFPRSSVIHGQELCRALASHDRIELRLGTTYVQQPPEDVPTVFATGAKLLDTFNQTILEAIVIPGQINGFEPINDAIPDFIVARNGYVAPVNGKLFAGSTYEYKTWPTGEATRTNRTRVESLLPQARLKHIGCFRAERVVSSDRLPIAGKIADNQWTSLAHGSGGTISAPYAAELIANSILGEVNVGSGEITRLLEPSRFQRRQARRPNPLAQSFQGSASKANKLKSN